VREAYPKVSPATFPQEVLGAIQSASGK